MDKKYIKLGIVVAVLALASASVIHSIYVNDYSANGAETSEQTGKPVKNTFSVGGPSLASSDRALSVTNITLNKGNLLMFRAQVDPLTVAAAQRELLQKSAKLKAGEPIYIYLDTPGGDIPAGNHLIDTAKGLGRPVHTITLFAASMGFNIAQRLDTRYVIPSGTYMAHRARVAGVGGQVPGEFITAAANLLRLTGKMETQNAKRLGISLDEYTNLVKDEYWVDGEDAVRQGVADKLANVKCDSSLDGEYETTEQTFFGPVTLVWANCPAVTAPLGFKFGGGEGLGDQVRNLMQNFSSYGNFKRASK